MTTASPDTAYRDYLNERDLAARWGCSLRTVQRRVRAAGLRPIGLADRAPHFPLSAISAYEADRAIVASDAPSDRRPASLNERTDSPIYSLAIAHRKGGQSKTSTCFYLARELHAAGQRVILRDLDAQRSLTKILLALGAQTDQFGRVALLRRVVLVPDGAPLPFAPDVELLDTPPALDDSVPGILRADGLIIPLLTEFQGVSALADMLEYLDATKPRHPNLRVLGILPTRYIARWTVQRDYLQDIRELGVRHNVPVLPPIPESRAVMVFSMAGRLWRPLAQTVLHAVQCKRADHGR